MTCQECELKLGMGEPVDDHLASCKECRWLAEELRLNAEAMRDMRLRPRMHWEWALAAAAMIVMAFGAWRMTRVEKPTAPVKIALARGAAPREIQQPVHIAKAVAPVARPKVRRVKHEPAEPLRVKMLTSDPDVVIYWIVDRKGGSE
jgi:hypothetical protein